MKAARVFLLDAGTLEMDGFHIFWNRGPGGPVRIPCYSVLIDHPEGKILFDTGFGLEHTQRVLPFEKPEQTPEQSVPGQLALAGYRVDEVTHVVNSHFHFDHCGANDLLHNASFFCHRLEYEAAEHPQSFEALGYSDLSFAPQIERTPVGGRPDPRAQGVGTFRPRFELLSGDTEILDGVRLIETPGHSAGHCSLLVELDSGRKMLFTADAAYGSRSLETGCIASFHFDPVASVKSMERLASLAKEEGCELFFSHEAESFAQYIRAPGFYS